MNFRVFSIPTYGDEQAEKVLNQFLSSHQVVQVEKQLICAGGMVHWSFCVTYQQNPQKLGEKQQKSTRVDYREILDDDEFACFVGLRELRKEVAEKEGLPVFAVFTNEQLSAMAQMRSPSLEKLRTIDGVGEGKVKRYSQVFLKQLQNYWQSRYAETTKSLSESDRVVG